MPVRYTVKAGDCIDSIAFEHGFFPETLWDLPENAELKATRKDRNVLHAGDVVVIPDKRTKKVAVTAGQSHRFQRKGVPKQLRIQLKLLDSPIANAPYELVIDGASRKGTTDAEGWLSEWMPPNSERAELHVEGTVFTLDLGHLDPADTIAGVQERLRGLGFYTGPADGQLSAATREALRSFQEMHGLEATGQDDEPTRAKLVEIFGA